MKDLNNEIVQNRFFEKTTEISSTDDGNRDIKPLYPFVISGGMNTERGYFIGINKYTDFHLNIVPKYFGDESAYTTIFPQRIEEILNKNNDAVIFCVFDMDTNYAKKNVGNRKKHDEFCRKMKDIKYKNVYLCPSMPSIEYWFLLHFENKKKLFTTRGAVNSLLGKYMKQYFKEQTKTLGKILKTNVVVDDVSWVEKLCGDGNLEKAIKMAKRNIKEALENNNIENISYSYVYQIFDKYFSC